MRPGGGATGPAPGIVSVEHRNPASLRGVKGRVAHAGGTAVPLLPDQAYPAISCSMTGDTVDRVVRGRVVDDDDFNIRRGLREDATQRPVDVGGYVVRRDDNADVEPGRADRRGFECFVGWLLEHLAAEHQPGGQFELASAVPDHRSGAPLDFGCERRLHGLPACAGPVLGLRPKPILLARTDRRLA